MYDLTQADAKIPIPRIKKERRVYWIAALVIIFALAAGFFAGGNYYDKLASYLKENANINLNTGSTAPQNPAGGRAPSAPQTYTPQTTQEQAVIGVVKDYSPAVVSIIISKNVPVMEKYYISPFDDFNQFFEDFGPDFTIPQYRQNGTRLQEVGGGSGFFIASDGMILTNKHVVSDTEAEYTVFTLDGKKYPAKVLARDPAQDLAIIKIEGAAPFPTVKLGDSGTVQIGQSVIAIGNALGEFNNTVSVGVISGLSRTITAGGGGMSETLENIIQTDAAINEGNSGGPLFNLKGEVIGLNTAIAGNAQNIGFAIPINVAKKDIDQVKTTGQIVYPFLGVNYVTIDSQVQQDNKLPVDYGAWITTNGQSGTAVVSGSAAALAGLRNGDIILEIDGQKLDTDNTLSEVIAGHNPGDTLTLLVLRDQKNLTLPAVLGKRE